MLYGVPDMLFYLLQLKSMRSTYRAEPFVINFRFERLNKFIESLQFIS